MSDDLVTIKKRIEELKSKKQRYEERVKMLTEQKTKIEQECLSQGIDINSLVDEIAKLTAQIDKDNSEAIAIAGGV